MKLQWLGENSLLEDFLTEDKQVKFGGEVNPKYGWCVIYAGGPASGKSSSAAYNVPIVGKKIDVDEFKSLENKLQVVTNDNIPKNTIEPGFVKKFENGKYYREILNSEKIGGDIRKMNMGDPDYVSTAHEILDPLTDKIKASMRNIGKYNSQERLPNIIFDQTSKNASKVLRMVNEVKQYGYKVAIIWVLTDMSKNFDAFTERGNHGRKMDPSLFMDIHPQVIKAMLSVFENPEMLSQLDEFWVIHNTYMKQNTQKRKERQIKAANVYSVPLVPDGLKQVHLVQETGIKNKGKQKRKTLYDVAIEGLQFIEREKDNFVDEDEQ